MSLEELRSLLIAKPGFSNELLSDQESLVVRSLLSNALKELDSVERELSPGSDASTPSNLEEKYNNALAQVDKYRIAIAPHKKLPTEILAEIFILCTPVTGVLFPPDPKSAPWSTGRVCSSWRRIVATESQIWRHVQLMYQYSPRLRRKLNIFTHTTMLSRQLVSLEAGMSLKSDTTFAELIAWHSATLEELTVSLRSSPSTPILSVPVQFKSLKRLTLRLPPGVQLQPTQITAFSNAPSLLEVEIETAGKQHILFRSFPIHLPWAQLRNLVLKCMEMTPSQLCSILRYCSALVDGVFRLADEHHSSSTTSNIVVPALQTLILHLHYGSRSLRKLFPLLKLPVLDSFAIFGSDQMSWPHDEFCSLLHRSSCSLQSFETGFSISDQGVVSLLREVPTLKELKLPLNWPLPVKVIKQMTDECLAPELEVFHFGTASVNAALDLMGDRWPKDETNVGLPVGIWEAIIGWRGNAEDRTEGLMRYDAYAKSRFWKEERSIELRFVK